MNLLIRFNEETLKWEIGYYFPELVKQYTGYELKYNWYEIERFISKDECYKCFHYLNGGN